MSSAPTEVDFEIIRGSTFETYVRWETEPFMFARIASVSAEGPLRIVTQAPHGMVDGWRVAIVGAAGLEELNACHAPPRERDFLRVKFIDATTIELNDLASEAFPGRRRSNVGTLQWYSPHEIAGYIFRMSIKNRVGGTVLLTSLDNGAIDLDPDDSLKHIRIRIEATDTEPLDWLRGVHDLEAEAPDGTVHPIVTGCTSVSQEVTTPIV